MEDAGKELEKLRSRLVDYKQTGSISAVADRRSGLVRELQAARETLNEARRAREKLLTRYEPGHVSVTLEDKRVAALAATETQIQKQLEALERQQSGIEALTVRLRSQEDIFLELKRNYEQARLKAASNADTINVRLVEYAAVPAKPKYPVLLFVLLSMPLGLMLSISVALLREYMDHRVSDPDTAESALGVPCIGSVPWLGFWSAHKPGQGRNPPDQIR